jgi:BTB/POZ domain
MHEFRFSWLTARPVYFRDFAYPNSKSKRIAMDQDVRGTTAAVFAELLSGPTVDVYLGEEQRHWTLHANLLSYHSEYLQRELQQQWDAKSDKSDVAPSLRLDLPTHDAKGFELLVKWFYQGRLDDVSDIGDAREKYEYAAACHRLYALCEQFAIPNLMNRAMDQYRKGLRDASLVPDAEEMSDIYARSPVKSPFRTLMTQIAARQIMDPDSDKDAVDYRECFASSPDFAIQLINAIRQQTGGLELSDPTEGEGCDYHEHDDNVVCYFEGGGLWLASRLTI